MTGADLARVRFIEGARCESQRGSCRRVAGQTMTRAVDTVRKQEHRAFLRDDGDSPLTKTKYLWLCFTIRPL